MNKSSMKEPGSNRGAAWRVIACPGGCFDGRLYNGDPNDRLTERVECDRCDGNQLVWLKNRDGERRTVRRRL